LDGQLIEPAVSTLGEALDAARRRTQGRLIIEVLADGSPVPSAHLDQPPATAPYAGDLRLTTADTATLVKGALLDAADLIGHARETQEQAARLIHAGRIQEAMAEMESILQAWAMAHGALKLAREARASGAISSDTSNGADENDLMRLLTEVRRALANRDWSALADALEYDLGEQASNWGSRLTAIADRITVD
ncbi:MAG TPA: hypothetical protein VG797_09160, partial [Phycisphaerales bacterium]|nr:hypothetical protein [Phycisphaerales bacterium]